MGMPGPGGARPPLRPGGPVPPGGRPGAPNSRQGTGRPMPGELPTDHLPPVAKPSEGYRREPNLLTHRDDDYLQDAELAQYAEEPGGYSAGYSTDDDRKFGKRRKIWRWVRRSLYILVFLGITVPVAVFYVIYQNVTVPDPQTVAVGQAQPVTIYYADGSVMDKISTGARTFIKSDQIPKNVREAVEAAEDETFETNNGFDLAAIGRTVRNQLTGGTGGGSTITQEYIKVATGNDQHSLSRKMSEVVEAYKMTKTYTNKSDILAAYLNIVYFGRGAYGIQSAAQSFFGVTADKLTPEQSALLAGLIQAPGRANDATYEKKRFTYVWGRMNANHWITPTQYKAGKFPTPITQKSNATLPWDRQLIEKQVMSELATDGWSDTALKGRGAQIYTTIQPKAQGQAESSVTTTLQPDAEYMNGQPLVVRGRAITNNGKPVSAKNPQVKATEAAALVSVNPSTGEIMAYYGGNDPKATQIDMADTPHQPGSSFKPYVFAAGLQQKPDKIGINAVFDPKDKQVIAGHLVHNADGDSCPDPCTVKDAMTNSINTVFYYMGNLIGTNNVRQAAYDAGIPKTEYVPQAHAEEPSLVYLDPNNNYKPGVVEGGISIGQYPVRPLDQAQGYATLANNGNYLQIHFVRKVTDIGGKNLLYQFSGQPKPAFSSDPTTSARIARTVSDAMSDVAPVNKFGLSDGRPADAKTGTQNYVAPDGTNKNYNSDAWAIGFTPQVVTSVWFGHYDNPGPIFGNAEPGQTNGYSVFGRMEPGLIWKNFMDSYLQGQPVQQFPTTPPDIGGSYNFITMSDQPTAPPPSDNQPSSQQMDTTTQTTTTTPPPTDTTTHHHGGGGGGGDTTTPDTPTSQDCSNPLVPGCTGGGGPGGNPPPGNNPGGNQQGAVENRQSSG
jgi:membrane peptidoglycan carboxypeptidase